MRVKARASLYVLAVIGMALTELKDYDNCGGGRQRKGRHG